MTAQQSAAVARPAEGVSPTALMKLTVDALIQVCAGMRGPVLKARGGCVPFKPEGPAKLDCGSTISLVRPGKSWNLALFGTTASCRVIGRVLLAEKREEEIGPAEIADALGEMLNIVAGATKRKLPADEAKQLQLGLPLFLSGTDCFRYLAKGIKVYTQRLAGPAVDLEVILVWKEG